MQLNEHVLHDVFDLARRTEHSGNVSDHAGEVLVVDRTKLDGVTADRSRDERAFVCISIHGRGGAVRARLDCGMVGNSSFEFQSGWRQAGADAPAHSPQSAQEPSTQWSASTQSTGAWHSDDAS